LEDVVVGPEGDGGTGLLSRLALAQRAGGDPVDETHGPDVTVCLDLDLEAVGQRVDYRDAHAVRTTGDGVPAAAELAPGVQDRQHHLDGGLALGLDDAHRDAAAVVDHPDSAVGQDRDLDPVAVPRERLVDGVVDDLLHHVVQTAFSGGADVHAGTLADGFEPLENADVLGSVGLVGRYGSGTGDRWCRHYRWSVRVVGMIGSFGTVVSHVVG